MLRSDNKTPPNVFKHTGGDNCWFTIHDFFKNSLGMGWLEEKEVKGPKSTLSLWGLSSSESHSECDEGDEEE